MSTYERTWALCGGWGVDAWLGRQSRQHFDVDIAVFHDEQSGVLQFLTDGWLLNGHDALDDEGKQQWDGRELSFPAHVHAYRDTTSLDFQLELRDGDDWVLATRTRLVRRIARCVRRSAWPMPTLGPEVILFYKAAASSIRPHDEADFRAMLPLLGRDERAWLRGSVAALRPDHDWLAELG